MCWAGAVPAWEKRKRGSVGTARSWTISWVTNSAWHSERCFISSQIWTDSLIWNSVYPNCDRACVTFWRRRETKFWNIFGKTLCRAFLLLVLNLVLNDITVHWTYLHTTYFFIRSFDFVLRLALLKFFPFWASKLLKCFLVFSQFLPWTSYSKMK